VEHFKNLGDFFKSKASVERKKSVEELVMCFKKNDVFYEKALTNECFTTSQASIHNSSAGHTE
jgi:hypothetical protein